MASLALLRCVVPRPWLLFATAALAGCGGSSSETPPPLTPDPLHAAYRPESAVARAAGNRKAARDAERSSDAAAEGASPRPAASGE